jgi:hypothetical protein
MMTMFALIYKKWRNVFLKLELRQSTFRTESICARVKAWAASILSVSCRRLQLQIGVEAHAVFFHQCKPLRSGFAKNKYFANEKSNITYRTCNYYDANY